MTGREAAWIAGYETATMFAFDRTAHNGVTVMADAADAALARFDKAFPQALPVKGTGPRYASRCYLCEAFLACPPEVHIDSDACQVYVKEAARMKEDARRRGAESPKLPAFRGKHITTCAACPGMRFGCKASYGVARCVERLLDLEVFCK